MRLADITRLAGQLDGVAERRRRGLLDWRYAAVWSPGSSTIATSSSASFDSRDFLLRSFPETFSVPARFAKHMMIVADLTDGDANAIEDAVIGAWELQSAGR